MEDIHAVCHARTIFYPDKAEQVIESMLKNPEKTCSLVHASATQQGGFGQRRTFLQIYLPARRIAPMKSSFVKAGGSDVKYISAVSLFNKVRRCLETLGVAE
jgi:hypothetical protein